MKYTIIVFLVFLLTNALEAYEVKGRVMIGDEPVYTANVNVYDESLNLKISVKTDELGYFNLSLDEGTYFFEANCLKDNKKYVGFSGKNPVYVSQNEYIGIKLLPYYNFNSKKSKTNKTKVKGQVIYDGKPLKDAVVYVYLSLKDIKGMPYQYTVPTDRNGNFEINEILPGKYFIIARKKRSGSYFGPVEEGDFIGFFQQNPINFEKGKVYNIKIPVFKKIQDDVPNQVKTSFRITGYAVDENDKPVAGVYAFVYKNKEMGHERPVSISKKTKEDGFFELFIPDKGKYYLGVRQFYGGTPVQGELYGLYDKTFDHHLIVEKDIENIKITVKKILQ